MKHEEIEAKAWRVFNLSLKRAKHQCPPWAKMPKHRRKFLKIYKKAVIKNRFCSHKIGGFYHVDHIIPLHGEHVSGLHVPWNLKVLPAAINMAKGTMIVEEYGLRFKEPNDSRPWGGSFSVRQHQAKSNQYFAKRKRKA